MTFVCKLQRTVFVFSAVDKPYNKSSARYLKHYTYFYSGNVTTYCGIVNEGNAIF